MSDHNGGSKQGRGQGRGRGRGGRGGQAQAIKNLERTATNIQNILQKMTTSDDQDSGGSMAANRRKDSRGSKSLMGLNFQDSAQRGGPSYQNPSYQGTPNQDCHYLRPPSQGSYHQSPCHQDPLHPSSQSLYNHIPPNQEPYYPGPPRQRPCYHGPPGHGPYYHGPPNQGPYHLGQYNEAHPNQYAPPPSYDECVRQYGGRSQSTSAQNKPKGRGKAPEKATFKPVSAQQVVKTLALFEGQMTNTEIVSKQVESSIEEVEKVVKHRKDIFAHMKDGTKTMVELVPHIKLCSSYLPESGCTAEDACQALHLCKDFIMTRCNKGPSCSFGHKMDTYHNASILSKMYLDLIKTQTLLSVIRKVCRRSAPPKICSYYTSTKDGCRKKDNCRFLHICKEFVMNDGQCCVNGCSLNHKLIDKQCSNVLTHHDVSANESIRDILVKLKSGYQSSAMPGEGTKNEEERQNEERKDSSDSDISQNPTEASVKKKTRNKSDEKTREKDSKSDDKAKGKSSTIKSTDFCGDIEIPEICIYAVHNKCKNERKGCKYLHAKSLFHWQVEKENKWYNFRIFQSKTLERAYRDVSKSGVKLSQIDALRLSSEDKMILGLMGTNIWTANFKEMCIADLANNKLNIRRVSTRSSAMSPLPQATVYEWYFADEQGKWISFDHVNSLYKQDLLWSITSEDIEKHYLNDSSSIMAISNNLYKCEIDFMNMTQTNLSNEGKGKAREIRRRPSCLSYQKAGITATTTTTTTNNNNNSSDGSLPAHWQPMSPNQTHVLVTLDPSQAEHQNVAKSIKLMIPTAKICEVRRLQNGYLWRLFRDKKDDLSHQYDDDLVTVYKLYHGTDSDFISVICKENIDGLRYANTKKKYGNGTYFSHSPAIARTYCTPDEQGHFFLIMAEVIIGSMTVGKKSLNRPPPNSLTTVDNMSAPTIFVKYDKDEYYPEYIIEVFA